MRVPPKYPSWIRNRDIDFLPEKQIKEISEREGNKITNKKWTFRQALYKNRSYLKYSRDNYDKIKRLEKEIKETREKIHHYKQESNMLWEYLVPFKERYSFTTSVIKYVVKKKFKKGEKKYEYFLLTINRPNQKKPINLHLGSEKSIIEYLSKRYPKEKQEIQKGWKNLIIRKTGDIREKPFLKIQDMMIKNPTTFQDNLKKDDVFV